MGGGVGIFHSGFFRTALSEADHRNFAAVYLDFREALPYLPTRKDRCCFSMVMTNWVCVTEKGMRLDL